MLKKGVIAALAIVFVLGATFVAADPGTTAQSGGKKKACAPTSCGKKASCASACAVAAKTGCSDSGKKGMACASVSCKSTACKGTSCKGMDCGKSVQGRRCVNAARKAHYSQVKSVATDIPYRENTRLVLSGTLHCGRCDLEKTDKCQPFIKTDAGDLYPLEHKSKVKCVSKTKGTGVKVIGRVSTKNGVDYVNVTSHEKL